MAEAAYAALALILVSSLLLGATVVADEGLARTGERTDVVQEEFTPNNNEDTWVKLDNSDSDELTYSDKVEVKDQNGNHSIRGEDYEWNTTNGTVKPLSGGNLDGDASAEINYTIWNPTDQDEDVGDLIVTFINAGQWIPLLLLVILVIIAIAVLGGLA